MQSHESTHDASFSSLADADRTVPDTAHHPFLLFLKDVFLAWWIQKQRSSLQYADKRKS